MTVTPRGQGFQVYVKVGDLRWRANAPTAAIGEAWEAIARDALTAGHMPDKGTLDAVAVTGNKTLEQASVLVQGLPAPQGWADLPCLTRNTTIMSELCAILPKGLIVADMAQTHVDLILTTLVERKNSNATVNRKLAALSKVVNRFCVKRAWRDRPLDLSRLKETEGRIRFLVGDEEDTLLTTTRHLGKERFADLWVYLIDTGARRGEALSFEPARDYQGGVCSFWRTKGNKPRSVPVTARVRTIIEAHKGPGRLFDFTPDEVRVVWDRVRGLLEFAEDDEWVIHMLRHTCASRLVQRGVPLPVVKEWMGHKSITTTMRYAHLCPTNLTQAVAALEPVALAAAAE